MSKWLNPKKHIIIMKKSITKEINIWNKVITIAKQPTKYYCVRENLYFIIAPLNKITPSVQWSFAFQRREKLWMLLIEKTTVNYPPRAVTDISDMLIYLVTLTLSWAASQTEQWIQQLWVRIKEKVFKCSTF